MATFTACAGVIAASAEALLLFVAVGKPMRLASFGMGAIARRRRYPRSETKEKDMRELAVIELMYMARQELFACTPESQASYRNCPKAPASAAQPLPISAISKGHWHTFTCHRANRQKGRSMRAPLLLSAWATSAGIVRMTVSASLRGR
jgi:hypothetical protein